MAELLYDGTSYVGAAASGRVLPVHLVQTGSIHTTPDPLRHAECGEPSNGSWAVGGQATCDACWNEYAKGPGGCALHDGSHRLGDCTESALTQENPNAES